MNIGKELKRVRKEFNTNQKDFASKLGLSKVHYNAIENDRRVATIGVLEKVANITGTRLLIIFIDK